MDTGLKIFRNRLSHFFSEVSSYKEVLFLYMFSLLLLWYIVASHPISVILLLFYSLSFAGFFILVYRKKTNDIRQVVKVIKQIRETVYISHDQIELPPNLKELESEMQLAYRQIQRDIGSLSKLEKVRTEFLGNVSHELKTPLFAIQGYLETLLNGAMDDPKVNTLFLEKAYLHSNNLASLLNDLVEISLIEAGEMRMSFRYFSLCDFLKSNFSDYASEAEKKGISFSFILPERDFQVYGDKNRLKQVMHNLIQNALKYTETGNITVTVAEENKTALITVRDTGIGIPPDDISRVFERFFRVDKARSKEIGGTGLGLAIVKHIIEAHGSVIEVRSEPGKGSEFYFKLKK